LGLASHSPPWGSKARCSAGIGAAPQGLPQSQTAALPPDYQPETGQQKELPPNLKKQLVDYP